jgi:Tol biopolymer transport system component
LDARRHAASYAAEPGQRCERVAVQKDAIFSGAPAVSPAGLFYQSIGRDRYVLRWLHGSVNEELVFDGHAFGPKALSPDGPIYFELVAHGTSRMMAFDPATRQVTPDVVAASTEALASGPASAGLGMASPDGRWIAFESEREGAKQIWLRDTGSGTERRVTGGNCNSSSPVWELDSSAIIFASDCGRGIGLPSLYRAKVASD